MRIIAIQGFLDKLRGAELTFMNMVLSLRDKGHSVDVWAFDISDYYKNQLESNEVNLKVLKFNEISFGKPLSVLNSYLRIFNLFRATYLYYRNAKEINNRYDLAFVHHYNYSPLSLIFLKIPKVYYCQEPPRGFYEPQNDTGLNVSRILSEVKNFIPRLIEKQLDRFCVSRADLVLCNSQYSRDYIGRTYSIAPVVNYLGVDFEKFRGLHLEKENLILSVGAIHEKKAHDFVIRSIGFIPLEKRPELIIIGNGLRRDKEILLNLAKERGVHLEIKSNIPDEEVVELYNKAKVVAIAYMMEPSIEPEALACGTPVVAVNEGGIKEAITRDVGILTNRDEEEFSKAIEYLLDNPEIGEEMGKKGIERVRKNYRWEKCAESLEVNFKKAINIWKQRKG